MLLGRKFLAVALALAMLLLQVPMALAGNDVSTSATSTEATDAAEAGEAADAAEADDVSASATPEDVAAPNNEDILTSLMIGDKDFAEAMAAGREVSSMVSAYWHGFPLLDEETNSLLTSLLDSIQIYSNTAIIDEASAYSVAEIMMSGSSAVLLEEVLLDGQIYVNSPLLQSPVAFNGVADIMTLYQSFLTYMAESGVLDSEANAQLSSAFGTQMTMAHEGDAVALVESLNLEPLTDALTAWFEDISTGEAYDGDIVSAFNVRTSSAMLYQVTKEDIVSLLETALPLVMDNAALWRFILENAATDMPLNEAGEPMTTDEMIAFVQAEMDVDMMIASLDEIPDDITLYYAECFDENGAVSTRFAHAIIPGETDGEKLLEAYVEWLPDCSQVHMSFADEYSDGFIVDVAKGATEAEGMTDQLTAVLSIISSEETVAQYVADVQWGEVLVEDGVKETRGSLLLGMVDAYTGTETGIAFDLYEVKEFHDIDVTSFCTVTMSLVMGGGELPIVTLNIHQQTGEPYGMPFDPAQMDEGVEFVYPAQMDTAEFAQWFEGTIAPATIQAGMSFLSLLPPDVFAWFITQTGMLEGMH